MEPFHYRQTATIEAALDAIRAPGPDAANDPSAMPASRFLAGGTTLVDLMKLNVERPTSLVDINPLPLARIEPSPHGGLSIGAMVRNSDLAANATIRECYPVLSEALLSGASPQLRNMATTGGNLLQRTRCYYFRDTAYTACNKRNPGTGCAAVDGHHRMFAILGTSEHCIATHPSDMDVAMMALEATIHTQGPRGERAIPIGDFYLLPGDTPHKENVLAAGELITRVTLPALATGTRSHYLKLRDRAAYEFALASAAVVIELNGRRIRRARVAFGGIATRPWRSPEAERALEGREAGEPAFRAAAQAALAAARPLHGNAFKVELAQRCLVRALTTVTSEKSA